MKRCLSKPTPTSPACAPPSKPSNANTTHKKTDIPSEIEELVGRVESFAAGNEPARVRRVKIPPPVKSLSSRAIRTRLGCTQSEFAALRLLAVARRKPEALQAV